MQSQTQEFSSFQLPRKEMHDLETIRYRVYASPREFVIVTANSAAEAMKVANIKHPSKVQREFPLYQTLLSPEWLGLPGNGIAGEVPVEALKPAEPVETAAVEPQAEVQAEVQAEAEAQAQDAAPGEQPPAQGVA